MATIAAHVVLMVTILRPVALADGRPLMDIDSGPLVDRVARLAHQMNIAPPAIRRIPSISSDLDAVAFLSGLPAYTVLVSDGLQQRLTPEEQEAILTHELGHIANGSLWWYALIAPLAASVPVVVSLVAAGRDIPIDGQLMTLLPLACAVHVGIKRLIGRTLEYDCDRRAAAVAGASSMASALQKIHAIGRVPESGLLSWLLHATAVHPSNDERIDTLDWRAPITDLVQVPWRKAEVSRRRWAVRAAAALWVAILAVSLMWILTPDRTWPLLPDALLFTTAGVPFLLLVALQRRRTRFARKQNALRPRGRKVALAIWLASAGGLVWLVTTYGLDFLPWSDGMESGGQALFSMALLVAAVVVLLRSLFVRVMGVPRTTPIDRQILQHLLSRQYSEGLDLARR
ncbi:MAG: hypothetical protein C0506_17055, partial [Anaerolinea sp.]|nr:hypothetical protein [Anaerolinea sp.]